MPNCLLDVLEDRLSYTESGLAQFVGSKPVQVTRFERTDATSISGEKGVSEVDFAVGFTVKIRIERLIGVGDDAGFFTRFAYGGLEGSFAGIDHPAGQRETAVFASRGNQQHTGLAHVVMINHERGPRGHLH